MRTQLRRRSISDFSHTPLVAALAAALAPQAAQAINIVVDNNSDSSYYQDLTFGTTLRGAIDYLNSNCSSGGGDSIKFFHANGNTPFVTAPATEIDVYCGGLTIDGEGSMTNSLTVIQSAYGGGSYALWSGASTNVTFKGLDITGYNSGTALGGHLDANNNILHSNATGIFVAYGGTSITNNTIFSNQYDAIDIENSPNATVSGNVIGLDTNGNWSPNGEGIFGYASHLAIDSNVISANNGDAIDLEIDSASTITGNKIGTDASGTVALGNEEGIYLWQASGTTINNGNVISSSYGAAIYIDVGSSGITVDGNAIGTDPTRNQDISNENGITAFCSSGIQITNNAIASNWDYGIQLNGIVGGGSMDIVNNAINVAGDGVTALGGSSYGVMLLNDICTSSLAAPGKKHLGKRATKVAVRTKSAPAGATTNVMIRNNNISNASFDGIFINGGYNNTITGNTIQNNGGYGVDIFSGTGNSIVDNPKIYGNGSQTSFVKNINLDFPGGIYTSGPDSSHANNGQNPPTVTGAVVNYSNGQTTVHFTLTAPPGSYEVQVCDNPVTTPGCNNLDTSTTVTVPAAGSVSGAVAFFGISSDNFSATATSSGNDTSEFSSVFTITPAPNVTYSPASKSIDFGNVAVNGSSPPMTITLTSSGSTPYTLNNIGSPSCGSGPICYGGAFTCTTTCVPGNSYNPGGGCNVTATFNPTALTTYSQTIGICDDSPSYGGTITLTGMGVTPPPVAINPASFDFGQQGVGTASNPQTFVILNGGTSSVLLGEPSVDDPNFVILSNGCGSSLAASESCPVVAEFLPQSGGSLHATLSMPAGGSLGSLQIKHRGKVLVAGPGPGTAATASLTGTGVAQGAITLPSSIDLGAYSVGSPPDQRSFTITNNGTAPVDFSAIAISSGPFQVVNGCPDTLAPGASCTVTLQYSASDLGSHTGTLTVNSDAEGGSRAIALTGVTVPSPVPILTVSPTQIGFGDRLLGSTSGTQRITITNVGNAPATLGLGMSNTDFLISFTSCAATLAPAASCYADVVLRPVGFGPRNGSLIVTSNSSTSPQGVGLSGSGCRPYSTGSSRLGSSFGCSP
ncbi:MAG: choice-of-anchor D domain-containing protein [Usitatibacter sp.]